MVKIAKIVGYGEDSLTLWALKERLSVILARFNDGTAPSDCLVFYRPSFGRHSRHSKAVFGEFDAMIVSSKNVYLVESKWDNLDENDKKEIRLERQQELRHEIFSWYLTNWDKKYSGNWDSFVEEQQPNLQRKFGKTIPRTNRLLARNLELVLKRIREHCTKSLSEDNIKNVLLFFHNGEKSKPPKKASRPFEIVSIDYSKEIEDNFVTLFGDKRSR
jgi:hypothetical protein